MYCYVEDFKGKRNLELNELSNVKEDSINPNLFLEMNGNK